MNDQQPTSDSGQAASGENPSQAAPVETAQTSPAQRIDFKAELSKELRLRSVMEATDLTERGSLLTEIVSIDQKAAAQGKKSVT